MLLLDMLMADAEEVVEEVLVTGRTDTAVPLIDLVRVLGLTGMEEVKLEMVVEVMVVLLMGLVVFVDVEANVLVVLLMYMG